MKLTPICDCKEDKVITGVWNGEPIWRSKTVSELYTPEMHQDYLDKVSGVNE